MLNPVIQIELLAADTETRILLAGYLGQYPLLGCSWSIEHGADSSQIQLDLPGDDSALNDRLLNLKLYSPAPPTQATQVGSPTTGGSGSESIGVSRLTQEQLIIEEAKRQGVTNPKQIAYILATAQHESDQFLVLNEYADGSAYEGRRDLGNINPGDGRKFKGRGYVQVTGRVNYERYSKLTGKDLISKPELAAEQPIARFTLVDGMKRGVFTGVGLDRYTSSNGDVDYVAARATVNGSDEANKIAGYARTYEQRLASGDLSKSAPPITPPGTGTVSTKLPTPTPIEPPKTEAGGKLILRVGEFGGLVYEYLYLLSDVTLSIESGSGGKISLSGVSPIWAINQYTQSNTRAGVTLKDLASEVARSRGLGLDFKGTGTEYTHVENNGLTAYQLLLRECSRAGYMVYAEGTDLRVHPIAPTKNASGQTEYSIQLTDILSFSLTSKPGGTTPGNTGGVSGSWGREAKIQTGTTIGGIAQSGLPIESGQKVSTENKPVQANLKSAKTSGMVTVEGKDGKSKQLSETAMRAEASRVMDLPATIDLVPRIEYLSIRPANTVKLPTAIVYSATVGEAEFWVSAVHFSYQSGKLSQSIDLYKPGVEVAISQALSGGGGVGTATVSPPLASGWRHPYPGSTMTAPWGQQRGNRRHAGQDWSTGSNKPLLAAADGQVTDVVAGCRIGDISCGGGYGNLVDIISNINGTRWLHRYGHCTSVSVKVGQIVKAGEQIAISGDTGHSYGEHLHFEIRKPDSLYGFGGTIDPKTVGI